MLPLSGITAKNSIRHHVVRVVEVVMKNLQLFDLESIDNIVSPENFEQTTLNSSARDIFTDFKEHKALVISENTLAIDAHNLMTKAHVQMIIVVSDNEDFLGVISSRELSERKIVSAVSKGESRAELRVADLMVPRAALCAFDCHSLDNATVSDVVSSLKNNGLRHCLVVDREKHHIRGVISSSDIARKLHLPIAINTKTSFSQIFQVIHTPEVIL